MTRSLASGAPDQPSPAMWWMTSISTDSSGPRTSSSARTGICRARSNSYRADWRSSLSRSAASIRRTGRSGRTSSGFRICWYGCPSISGLRVRSGSWRRTTSARAAASAPVSTAPVMCRASGMLYVADGPWSRCRNHRRSCAKDSGIRSGRGRRVSSGRAEPASCRRRCAARPAGVGLSKKSLMSTSRPSVPRIRPISRPASRECPPRSKKLSSKPTCGSSRISENSTRSMSSSGLRAVRSSPAGVYCGSGRASRSTLPFGVSGRLSSSTTLAGTRYAGSVVRNSSRNSAAFVAAEGDGTT